MEYPSRNPMSIVAAVMPAPRVPVELREFAEPALHPDPRCCARTIRRSAAPTCTCGTAGSRACRIRSFPATSRSASPTRCAATSRGVDGRRVGEGDRVVFFDVHRTCGRCRACTVHAHADAVRGAPRLRHHRLGGRRPVRRLGAGDLSRAGRRRSRGCPTRCRSRLHRRRLRPADRGPRRSSAPRSRSATRCVVQGTGAVGLSAIALARLAGAAQVIAIGAPADRLALARAMGADVGDRHARDDRRPSGSTGVRDADRRRWAPTSSIEAGGIGARRRGRARSGARRRPLRHRRPLHRRRAERDQRAPADQPQAPGDPRLLGQRGRPLRARAAHARAPPRAMPWRAIGARTYALAELNEALADAEAMRLPKALVKPN